MKRGKIISILVTVTLIGTFALTYISKTKEDISEDMLNSEKVAVLVEKLSKGDYGDKIKYSGALGFGETKNMISMIDEKVTYVGAKEGDYVKEGQVLVQFDSSKIDGNVEKARKEYESALEKARKSDGKFDGLKEEVEKKKSSISENKNRILEIEKELKDIEEKIKVLEEKKLEEAIGEEEYLKELESLNGEKIKLNGENLKVNSHIKRDEIEVLAIEKSLEELQKLNFSSMQVEASKKMYDEMLKLKENYVIKAPTNGKVTAFNAYLNEKIENKMMPVVTLGREDLLSFNFSVDKEEKDNFKKGESLEVNIENKGVEKGIVKEISKKEDMRTGRYIVEVEIPNNKNYKINSYANIYKTIENKENTNMISKNSLLREEDGDFVYIVQDGVAKKRKVSLGKENNDSIEISKGLKGEDLVVVKGKEFLEDGEKVEVMEASS